MILGPGLHRNVPKDAYLSDIISPVPSLSASTAKLLLGRSPAHAWSAHPKGGRFRDPDKDSQRTGNLFDSILLGGESDLVVLPDMLPNAKKEMVPTNGKFLLQSAKDWRDGQLAIGKIPVDADEKARLEESAEIIRQNLARDGVTLDGENQVTLLWEEGGVRCKGRMDHWKEDELTFYDLKTVECAHPDAIARKCIDFGWDIQAAAYTRGLEILRPEWAGRIRFVVLAVEPKPPHEVLVRPFAGTMRSLGEWKWNQAVRIWGECLKARRWPGYTGMEQGIEAPPWALAAMEAGLSGGSQATPF